MNTNLLERELPKWPQMVVTGRPVSPEQALEIIRRTDWFFQHFGFTANSTPFVQQARQILEFKDYDDFVGPDGERDYRAYNQWRNWYRKQWGIIDTAYVLNDWIASSYIGGPHGWCHPDGTIAFADNVGKWPSVAAIREDWKCLAEAFPFIDVAVTLMSGESLEEDTKPVVSLIVANGEVQLVDPADGDVHTRHGTTLAEACLARKDIDLDAIIGRYQEPISLETLKEWHDKVFGRIN